MRCTPAGKTHLAYSAKPKRGEDTMPSQAVCVTAKNSAMLVLRPHKEGEMYVRLYWQYDLLESSVHQWLDFYTDLNAFEDRFKDGSKNSVPNLERMGAQDLDAYSKLLTRELALR